MEKKVSGSTGAGHRGIDRHERNFDFLFLDIHQKILKIAFWILHLWKYSNPEEHSPGNLIYLDLL